MTKLKKFYQVELYTGTIVLDNRDRVFLIKEDDRNEIGKGRWNIPGGAVNPGEDLVTAAIRTTKEETGIDVKIMSLIGNYKCNKQNKEWVYIVFEARTLGKKGRISSPNVRDSRWFKREKFIQMSANELVHPDMQLVYQIAIEQRGAPMDSVKYIDYNSQ